MNEVDLRFLAQIVWLKELKNSEWNGEFLSIKNKPIHRINLIGTVVQIFKSEDDNYAFLTVDDGSDSVRCKCWREDVMKIKEFKEGDLVRVIGGSKSYNNEIYVSPIVVKKVDPHEWLLHLLDLKPMKNIIVTADSVHQNQDLNKEKTPFSSSNKETVDEVLEKETKKDVVDFKPAKVVEEETKKDNKESNEVSAKLRVELLKVIKMLDAGNGADLDLIISACGKTKDDVIVVLKDLMDDGEVFEPAPNKLRVLD